MKRFVFFASALVWSYLPARADTRVFEQGSFEVREHEGRQYCLPAGVAEGSTHGNPTRIDPNDPDTQPEVDDPTFGNEVLDLSSGDGNPLGEEDDELPQGHRGLCYPRQSIK